MEYKKGDIVRVKVNANEIDDYYIGWANEMNKYLGKELTVYECYKYCNSTVYKLEEAYYGTVNGDGYWQFAECWIEPVEEEILIDENDFGKIFA